MDIALLTVQPQLNINCVCCSWVHCIHATQQKKKTRRDDENGRENVKKGSDVRKITVVCALLLYENKDIELFLLPSPSSILALLLFSFHYVWLCSFVPRVCKNKIISLCYSFCCFSILFKLNRFI